MNFTPFLFLIFSLFSMACSSKRPHYSYAQQESVSEPSMAAEFEEDEDFGYAPKFKSAKVSKRKRGGSVQNNIPVQQQSSRMIHYNGYAKLKALKVEETLQSIIDLARANKGSLESRSRSHVTVRVPKKEFERIFKSILAFGDVLSKSITAEDVTEAFTSVELRLKTAKTTRERLLLLLEKAKDEKEKIQILKQIQRLNEEIDTMDAQLRILSGLANQSKISVEVVPKQQGNMRAVKNDLYGFKWIADLSPFHNRVAHKGKSLVLSAPKGMVRTTADGPFRAESADGSFLRSTSLKNNPAGDSEFWQQAIVKRLEAGYGKSSLSTFGDFRAVKFDAVAQQPYIYIVAVRARQHELDVVEIYYPDASQQSRYEDEIKRSLIGGEG